MEDTFINVLFVFVSLLVSKDIVHERDDDVTVGMRDYEDVLLRESEKLKELSIATNLTCSNQQASQNAGGDVDQTVSNVDQNLSQGDVELLEKPKTGHDDTHHDNQTSFTDQETAYSWYLWKTLSLISLVRFLKWVMKLDFKPRSLSSPNRKNATFLNSEVSEMDYKTLTSFYDQCVQVPASESWHTCEFVEGFANDLLEAVRNEYTDVKIEDCVGVGSLYEQWACRKSLVCDIHVPIIPPKPYSFEFKLLRDRTTLYSSVNMVKGPDLSVCVCNGSNLDDDTLCLLHPDKNDNIVEDCINGPLCPEDSPYLSKSRIVKWFRNSIKKAWKDISHKYDFELTFRNCESPGSVKVRFRSGKEILFNITPVVRVQGSDVHLISYLPSIGHLSDTQWPVCFARYENSLLEHFTTTLPRNSCHIRCLHILSFLHKHQIGLTGRCGLTSYHVKNALLHRLLADTPLSWRPEQIGQRLGDALTFLQRRVEAKVLHHALVGNGLIPSDFGFPKEFREGKPINLFQPLLSNEECSKMERHLAEMTKNIPVLIYEYSMK